MNVMSRIILILILLSFAPSWAVSAKEASIESLIVAWEKSVTNAPSTIVFKKISNNLYEYETNLFPYKGQIKINNTKIDSYFRGDDGNLRMGVVSAELVNFSNENHKKYNSQYNEWYMNNDLVYNTKTDKWLTMSEYIEILNNPNQNTGDFMGLITTERIGAIILILIIYIFFFIRKSRQNAVVLMNNHSKSMAHLEKSMELTLSSVKTSEETNELLREILEVLRKEK